MKKSTLLLFGILWSFSALAQDGPGGVSGASENGLWLKADDITQTNNTAVADWADASGNSNNAGQTDAALQPVYLETSSINGMPVVRLDGIDDQIIIPDVPILDGSSGISYYVVVRPNNLNGSPRGILGKRVTFTSPANYAYTWFFHTGNRLNLDVNTANDRFDTGSTTFSNATNYILGWSFDGTLASGRRSSIRNGNNVLVQSTETSTSVSNSDRDLVLGALNANYGTYLGADYAEVIHFNYALDSLDNLLVQNYLAAKYAIAISANDLYDEDDAVNGNYDFDVAGIGRISATLENNEAQGSGMVRMLNPTGLGDDEYLIWGHDNGAQQADNIIDVPLTVEARYDRVWRASEVNGAGSAVDVGAIDIRFDLTNNGPVTASDLRLLIDTDNDGVFSDETPILGATATGSNTYTFAGVTGIANNLRFTIGTINSAQTPLPIALLHFTATAVQAQHLVQLSWQTASENNNAYFTVERSSDATTWTPLNVVEGAGNSTSVRSYANADRAPLTGVSYYRLKQTDFDGRFTYSKTEAVEFRATEELALSPNPAKHQLSIAGNLKDLEQLRIFNAVGQEVTSLIEVVRWSETNVVVNVSALSSGMYFVKAGAATAQFQKL